MIESIEWFRDGMGRFCGAGYRDEMVKEWMEMILEALRRAEPVQERQPELPINPQSESNSLLVKMNPADGPGDENWTPQATFADFSRVALSLYQEFQPMTLTLNFHSRAWYMLLCLSGGKLENVADTIREIVQEQGTLEQMYARHLPGHIRAYFQEGFQMGTEDEKR